MLALKRTLILALLAIGGRVDADTVVAIRFTIDQQPGNWAVGEGTFSFADGLTTVGLGDLKTFFLATSVIDAVHGGPQPYNYEQITLQGFSATFEAGPTGPTLTSLAISTAPIPPPQDPLFPYLAFNATSLAKDGAFMERWESSVDEGVYVTGTMTVLRIDTGVRAVPEPSGAISLGLGATAIALGWRRRRGAG
ncbi:PEP-CTERM sorting domain-containing protein [Paludisphaera sp.]|uniref:PEP-CTERM sorting domain-containing protein n=1 Tax=Paludisphaera sp. TaxID=2017432 RepID=UPI00301CE2AB